MVKLKLEIKVEEKFMVVLKNSVRVMMSLLTDICFNKRELASDIADGIIKELNKDPFRETKVYRPTSEHEEYESDIRTVAWNILQLLYPVDRELGNYQGWNFPVGKPPKLDDIINEESKVIAGLKHDPSKAFLRENDELLNSMDLPFYESKLIDFLNELDWKKYFSHNTDEWGNEKK